MCFSRLKNKKSLTSKNSGTLIVNTFLNFELYKPYMIGAKTGAAENTAVGIGPIVNVQVIFHR
jgi:hypothetical protein